MNRKKGAYDTYAKALDVAGHNHYTAVALTEAAYIQAIKEAYDIYIEAIRARARKETT